MAGSLTSKEYWISYYKNRSPKKEKIVKIVSIYDGFWDLLVNSCHTTPKTIFEIGAYPGRYLAYLGAKYDLTTTGLDFNPDIKTIEDSMKSMGVDTFNYYCDDFLKHQPSEKFDLVFSNGFIEHFANFDKILDKHCDYLKEGGAVLVMIPNKRYLRKWFGYLCDYKNLKVHNLKSMSLKVFREFASRNNLEIVYLNYHGGFAFSVHKELNLIQKLIQRTTRLIFKKLNPLIAKYPNKYLSSNIVAIFKRS